MAEVQLQENADCEKSVFFHEFKHLDEFNTLIDEITSSINDIRKEEILLSKLTGINLWQPSPIVHCV